MSSAVSVATTDNEDEERAACDPFADARIEVPAAALRRVSPGTYLAGLKRRLDDVATRLTYGR